jgi:hypothetical protein
MKGYRYKMQMDGYNEGMEFYVYQLGVPESAQSLANESDIETVEFPQKIAEKFATNGSATPPRAVLVDVETGDPFQMFEYDWK